MLDLADLLARGYFPRELPPPFTTQPYSEILKKKQGSLPSEFDPSNKNIISKPVVHNFTRPGSLRRKFSIPNPLNFYQLAKILTQEWMYFFKHCDKSQISLSKPTIKTDGERAIERLYTLGDLPQHRAKVRATSRYILQTDIATFYPSVYTHSIPWALHTKTKSKANRTEKLIGNLVDRIIRNSQDGQTIGIPIGPDTSLLIAETINSVIDVSLSKYSDQNGYRYMDDFEFGFNNYAEAELMLAKLQELLNDFELQLNPKKTRIFELPEPLENPGIVELRNFPFRGKHASSQEHDLIHYFTRAFQLVKSYPDQGILRYAVSRLNYDEITENNRSFFQNLLLQCATTDPGTLPFVIEQLKRFSEKSYEIDNDTLKATLNKILVTHAPLGHGGEAAWALWGFLLFSIQIDDAVANKLILSEDDIVAILVLDAKEKGLISNNVNFKFWQSLMKVDELRDKHWLLAYEANIKGWLPTASGNDHVDLEPGFSFLKKNDVYFYDDELSTTYTSKKPIGPPIRWMGY
ncbi:MAG TPA: RNA-directed DNA polymerase [archaeon]|nr:RNA-directed DNA polymerase [archaeon]